MKPEEINTTTVEGRLLIAAIAKIMSYTDQMPSEIMKDLWYLADLDHEPAKA